MRCARISLAFHQKAAWNPIPFEGVEGNAALDITCAF